MIASWIVFSYRMPRDILIPGWEFEPTILRKGSLITEPSSILANALD